MTTATQDRDATAVPRLARLPVGVVAATAAVVHLVAGALGRGYWFDEALQLALGRHHLDWGSVDQPPAVPALAWLADAVAPASIPVLRVVPSLATAAAVLVAALIARELGGDRRAQTLTALAQATGLWTSFTGHWLTPYTLEPVQWLLVVWVLVRWMRIRDDRLLLVLGPLVGVAALTKFQVVLFGVVLLAAVLLTGPRDLLRRPALWVSVLLAALIAAPTMVWQAVNGWPQLQMGPVVAAESALFGDRPGIAIVLVAFAGVLGTVLVVVGLVAPVLDRRLRPHLFLTVTFAVLWLFFVVTAGRGYYLDGLHGALAAVGAVAFAHRREAGHRRWTWVAWPVGVLAVLAAAAAVHASTRAAGPEVPGRVTAAVAQVYDGLPPEQRARTVVFGQSYVFASFVDTADPRLGLPAAYSGNRSYGYFAPPPDDHDTIIFIGDDPGQLAPVTGPMRPAVDLGDGNRVWLGEGLHAPWSQVWPQLRLLTVS